MTGSVSIGDLFSSLYVRRINTQYGVGRLYEWSALAAGSRR